MYLKAIIAYYHAFLLHSWAQALLIWNFDLHVNVVNFHIIKIHESGGISRPVSPVVCLCVCVYMKIRPAHECMHCNYWVICVCVCVYLHAEIYVHMYMNVYVCVWLCVFVHLCVHQGFWVEITQWGLMCNYWHILEISQRSEEHARKGNKIWKKKKKKKKKYASI